MAPNGFGGSDQMYPQTSPDRVDADLEQHPMIVDRSRHQRKGPHMATADDLSLILLEQHRSISVKLNAVTTSSGAERDAIFDDLRRFLAVHEAAEQSWMHLAGNNDSGERCACDRHRQLDAVAQSVAELENLAIDSDQFGVTFEILTQQVKTRCDVEEHRELPRITTDATDDELKMILGALQSVATIVAGNGDSRSTTSDFTFADVFSSACRKLDALRADDELFI